MELPLVATCWPLLLAACQGTPPPAGAIPTRHPVTARPPARPAAAPPDAVELPEPAFDTLCQKPAGNLRIVFRTRDSRLLAVRTRRAGRPDTVLLGRYGGRLISPPSVEAMRPAGNGHYLLTLSTHWWDMGHHWDDVAVLCLGDTATTELLYAEEIDRWQNEVAYGRRLGTRIRGQRPEPLVPLGYRLQLLRQPASAGQLRWYVEVADSTRTGGVRVRARRVVACGCR